jgi:hypothetical protein
MAAYTDWMSPKWSVVSSIEADPGEKDVLIFTEDTTTGTRTIERWQIKPDPQNPQSTILVKVEDWATGCIWNSDDSVSATHDGQPFLVTRNGSMLACTIPAATLRRQQIRTVLLGGLSGGAAGLLAGVAIGVPPVEAVAVGFAASFLSAVVTAYSSLGSRAADVWVASGGGGGTVPPPRDPSTDPTERRAKPQALRSAEA